MTRDARREQVLEIAQELFATQGYHHVSMDDIAEQALVSKPVLYRHFPSKLDLYLAVVDRGGEALVRAVAEALEPISGDEVEPSDGKPVVHALVRAYFSYVETAGQSASLLFESDVTRDDDVRARVESASADTARHDVCRGNKFDQQQMDALPQRLRCFVEKCLGRESAADVAR